MSERSHDLTILSGGGAAGTGPHVNHPTRPCHQTYRDSSIRGLPLRLRRILTSCSLEGNSQLLKFRWNFYPEFYLSRGISILALIPLIRRDAERTRRREEIGFNLVQDDADGRTNKPSTSQPRFLMKDMSLLLFHSKAYATPPSLPSLWRAPPGKSKHLDSSWK